MCLGVPGQVVEILPDDSGMTMGKVSFGGISREVCLAYVPEVEIGQWVLVHVGFAINTLDEEEAKSIFEALSELEKATELAKTEMDEARRARGESVGGDEAVGGDRASVS